jgi:hypothetical protein
MITTPFVIQIRVSKAVDRGLIASCGFAITEEFTDLYDLEADKANSLEMLLRAIQDNQAYPWYFDFDNNQDQWDFDAYIWDPIGDYLNEQTDEEIQCQLDIDGVDCYIKDPSWLVARKEVASILKEWVAAEPGQTEEDLDSFESFYVEEHPVTPVYYPSVFNIYPDHVNNQWSRNQWSRVESDGRTVISENSVMQLKASGIVTIDRIACAQGLFDIKPILMVSSELRKNIMKSPLIHPTSKRFRPVLPADDPLSQVQFYQGVKILSYE